jgi:hypothetical protein
MILKVGLRGTWIECKLSQYLFNKRFLLTYNAFID